VSKPNYLGVPEDTLNKVVSYLLDRPYREVSELLKLLESEIVTIKGAETLPEEADSVGTESSER
jgi:hypothetical protein